MLSISNQKPAQRHALRCVHYVHLYCPTERGHCSVFQMITKAVLSVTWIKM